VVVAMMMTILEIIAKWSEAHTVFICLNTGIMGLNPTQGMDVCPCFLCVTLSCV